MERSPQLYLFEIQEMAKYLLSRIETKTSDDYLNDQDFRFAVERAFIIMGEALVLLKRYHPDVSDSLDEGDDVIRFRNFLVHRYWAIDHDEVWVILTTEVGPMKKIVDALLIKLDEDEVG